MDKLLQGKTILITGSSKGIGAATARLAKKYGANVILHGKSQSEELLSIAHELDAPHIICDVTDGAEVKKQIGSLRVDILVNNAGISISKPLQELTEEDWQQTFNTNVLGAVNCSKAVVPHMLAGKYGKIINVASIKGHTATAGRPAFAASKAALLALTASMAKEFAPFILVNAVSPGFTETETTRSDWSERIYKQIDGSLLKRAAKAEEIAEVILFLASDKSNYITGQTIIADGGYSLSI